MPYLVVDNFSAGLDSRRHVLNSKDGTLAVLKNAHITRGGEIEKRKAFAQYASLPANTFGLETTADKIYVFGSVTAPAMPAGITYQRLQHPDGLAMTKVVWSTVYGGLPFVIAEYADGKRYCFWDGSIIGDWFAGIVRQNQSLNNFVSGLAAGFSLPGYTCVASSNKLTITGPVARPFTVSVDAETPISAVVENKVQVVAGTPEVLSQASFDFVGYTVNNAGTSNIKVRVFELGNTNPLPTVTGIFDVTGFNLMNGPVDLATYYYNPVTMDPVPAPHRPDTWFMAICEQVNKRQNSRYRAKLSSSLAGFSEKTPNYLGLIIENVPGEKLADHYNINGNYLWIEFLNDPSNATGIEQLVDVSSITQTGTGRYRAIFRKDPWSGIVSSMDLDSVIYPDAWEGIANPPSFSDPPIRAEFAGGFALGVTKVFIDGVELLKGGFCSVDSRYKSPNNWGFYGHSGLMYSVADLVSQRINTILDANAASSVPDGFLTNLRIRAESGDSNVSGPSYGKKLTIKAKDSFGAVPNGKTISFETVFIDKNGPVNQAAYLAQSQIRPAARTYELYKLSITPSSSTMSGGVTGVPSVSQVTEVTILGSMVAGKKVSITINDDLLANPYVFGASRVASLQPGFSITYKAKEYAAVGSTMYFSALNNATKWGIYDLGSGFIDMSNNFGGRESLTGFGVYQNNMAVFSRRNVQLWYLDADPSQNQQRQILANTGCLAPDSVVSMGSIDLLYLADNGIRSLRARENTDTAFASDIGSPIDSIVIEHMATLTSAQIESARAIVEPLDGRYWLALGDKVFVLSYFPGSSISAWSMYELGFSITDMAVKDDKVYARSGNSIYVYGGEDGATYDSCQVVVELPYMDGRKPATYKRCKGVDVTIQGEWKVYMGFDHTNPNARDLIATPNQPTFAMGKIDAVGIGTHFGLRMTSQSPGYARIANVIVHFDEMQAKHEAG